MMRIDVVTVFPGMFSGYVAESMMARASQQQVLSITLHDLRDFTDDPHRVVDDTPFGGGGGMVLKPEPIARAVESISASRNGSNPIVCIIPTPRAPLFTQSDANELAQSGQLIFVCGHYTGIDERVFEHLNARRYSIGDYVLTGGELPVMVMIDAIARRLPGFLGNDESAVGDSHVRADGGLGFPQYTRPAVWRDRAVPEVLISGHHAHVSDWRAQQAREATQRFRPDLVNDNKTAPALRT